MKGDMPEAAAAAAPYRHVSPAQLHAAARHRERPEGATGYRLFQPSPPPLSDVASGSYQRHVCSIPAYGATPGHAVSTFCQKEETPAGSSELRQFAENISRLSQELSAPRPRRESPGMDVAISGSAKWRRSVCRLPSCFELGRLQARARAQAGARFPQQACR